MPTYHPAGEDGPNAMMAQAETERRAWPRTQTTGKTWRDPIRKGWPGPRASWTAAMVDTFDQAYHQAKLRGYHDARAYAEGHRAVTLMRQGRA